MDDPKSNKTVRGHRAPRQNPSNSERPTLPWWIPLLWFGLILTTVPLIRRFQEWIASTVGSEWFGYVTVTCLAAGTISAVLLLRRRSVGPSFRRIAWIGGPALIAVVWVSRLWGRPEEAIHLVEYGVLALFVTLALRGRFQTWLVVPAATLLCSAAGCIDEVVQWFTPGRFFDFRDIGLNAGAAALASLAHWKGVLEPDEPPPPTVAEVRSVLRLGALTAVILAMLLAATPANLGSVADRWPSLRRTMLEDDVIVEYGYRHRIPGIGVFFSRLSREDLVEADHNFDPADGAAIDASRKHYRAFLRQYHPGRTPFAYEARVHFFSRNRNITLARKHPEGSDRYRYFMSRALGEDRIIKSFFSNAQRLSRFDLPRHRRRTMEAGADPDAPFTSLVAAHVITELTAPQAVGGFAVLALVLLGFDFGLGRMVTRSRAGLPPTDGAR